MSLFVLFKLVCVFCVWWFWGLLFWFVSCGLFCMLDSVWWILLSLFILLLVRGLVFMLFSCLL